MKLIFVLGIIGTAVVTASACSLTNLDGYTSGGGATDTGPTNDATADAKTDVRADSTKTDQGVDSTGEDTTPDDAGADAKSDSTAGDSTGDGDTTFFDVLDTSDTAPRDSTVTDTGILPDTTPSGDSGVDPDAPCGVGVGRFGISEFMPRAVAGTGDKHEWIELTNFDTCTIDVSGVTLKVSSTVDRGIYTFLPGTTLAAGEAVLVVDDAASFTADISTTGFVPGKVFAFPSSSGDVIVNSTAYFRLYAPGATTPYEDVTASAPGSGWQANRSYAYPPDRSGCPLSARYSMPTGGSLGPAWKHTAIDAAYGYGATGTPALVLYGTPTKPNTGIACP